MICKLSMNVAQAVQVTMYRTPDVTHKVYAVDSV